MKVTEKDVAYVADLGNLELTGEERAGKIPDRPQVLVRRDSHGEDASTTP